MRDATQQPEWWTPLEAANRWRVSVSTIKRMLNRGDIAGQKIGDQWRIHITAIEAFEVAGKPKPKPAEKPDLRAFQEVTQYIS